MMKSIEIHGNSLKLIAISFLISICFYLFPGVAEAATCTHYASPNGGGNGLSQSAPFQISNFWSVAGPGKTLCLLDGTYVGLNSMINPPENLNGTPTQKITVKAMNDGAVIIDGQGSNTPVELRNNDYFVLEGFDAHDSVDDPVWLASGADFNIVRRVVGWNGSGTVQSDIFGLNNNTGNLLEDTAGFGTARKIYSNSQNGDNLTIRRAWGMWNNHAQYAMDFGSPKMVFAAAYNSRGAIYENMVGTWDGQANGGYAVIGMDGFYPGYDPCANSKYLGSIGYLKPGNNVPDIVGVAYGSRSVDCFEFKDVVLNAGSFSEPPIDASSFDGGSGSSPINCPVCNRKLTNLTEIGSTPSYIVTGSNGWTVSNRATGANIGSVPNIWNGSGTQGARVCKQYVNGQLTSTPLWPWPMDSRIRQALTRAGRNPDSVFGGTGNSVTQQMEQLFGPIPSECRTGDTTPSSLLGDINGDRIVNSLDWSLMSAKWLTSDTSADLNKDGAVNSLDWSIMSSNWLKMI